METTQDVLPIQSEDNFIPRIPHLKPTPKETMETAMAHLLLKWNFKVDCEACCMFHAGAHAARGAVAQLFASPCEEMPCIVNTQCQECGSLGILVNGLCESCVDLVASADSEA